MKTVAFTSTISPELISWLDKRARLEKRTRRSLLEEALKRYQRDVTRMQLKEGFARAAHDTDLIEMAEWGIDDYCNIVVGRA